MRMESIDKNFEVKTNIGRDDLCFRDAEAEPFRIYGLIRDEDMFCRMPIHSAKKVSEGVCHITPHTAGGRVRFITDSSYVAISAKLQHTGRMPHFALTGSAGFDLYTDVGEGQVYRGTFIPPFDIESNTVYESIIDLGTREKRVVTINFPLYSSVKKLYIGLQEEAILETAPDYKYSVPIVYYGSSITQGGCASRPGNAYPTIISRMMDCDFINLGFSGNAKGEDAMTDYINTLDMSMFVLDYDHNAPTPEHLEATHERMFQGIREKHPYLPIIMMTRPKVHLSSDEKRRVAIVERTYQNALATGDQNVYFIKGCDLIRPDIIETATVDGVHPNDSGFVSMAYVLYSVMQKIENKMRNKL